MAPSKRTMPTIVLLLLGSISTDVHAAITKTPSGGVFLEGSDVTLTCVVEGNDYVVWDDLSDATSIFIGKKKNNEKKKYDNFGISSVDGDFSLIIKDVQLSDEGTYVCKDQDRHATATVTIGVLPNVHLSVKQSEATQAPQTSTEVNIMCSAYNARPAVSVFELSVTGSEKTVNITKDKSNQNEDGITYNSSASLPYIMSSEEMSVYCRVFTAGRSIKHTENFYKPRCNISMSGNEIRCLCKANPQVNTYYIDFNGNNHDGDVLFIEEDDPMNIRCFAANELGTGQSDLLFPEDTYGFGLVPVAVIVSIVVLLVVLTVIYIRYRCGPTVKKSDEEQRPVHGAHKEESVNLLPQSEQIPPGNEEMSERKNTHDEEASSLSLKHDSSFPKTDLTSDLKDPQKFISKILLQVNKDWEIFAIDILNISERVVKEAVMKNNNLDDQINAATKNMTSDHIEVLDKNAELWEKFGFEYVKGENGCFLQRITKTRAEAAQDNESTNISSSGDILVSCGIRIGKVGIKKLLEAFGEKDIETEDGATILKMLEYTNVIRKPYVNLLRQLTNCKIYGARKILLFNFETDLQQLKATIRNHVKNDWEIFAIEILDIPKELVEDAVLNYDTYKEKSSNEDKICQQDPPTIESRDDMLKLCRERIGKVGICRLLAALTAGDFESEDETNVLKKLDENGVIKKDCSHLLSNLSDCKLFRARKIVIAYLEADLWNYITNSICPQISLDWEIFAVDVLKLHPRKVVDIIEHTKDENGRVLSMFRKWRYACVHETEISKQFLQDLINASEISSKILSKDNRPNNLKGKPTNKGDCSEEFLEMLTHLSKRIGVFGRKRLEEINSKGVKVGIFGTPEEITVDDNVNSLGQLCFMLYEANLFTARDLVITYIEKQLHEVIATISKERASNWDELAWYGLTLSGNDVAYLERAAMSNEERVSMAISKWIRKHNINQDVQKSLNEKALKKSLKLGNDA